MAAPVYLSNGYFNNSINAWREWEWQGPEPLNKRLMNFVSIILFNRTYNVTYSGTRPVSMVHKLQERVEGGHENDWVIFQYVYGSPMSIEVILKNGTKVKSFAPYHNVNLTEHN